MSGHKLTKEWRCQLFRHELSLIQADDHRKFAEECLNNIPDYFFTTAASSTGKYHPEYCLGTGGLVRHTKATIQIAMQLLNLEMFSPFLTARDEIITALLMHDSCKSGRFGYEAKGFTVANHPLLAADLVKSVADELASCGMRPTECFYQHELPPCMEWDYVYLVCELIRTHMGQWVTNYRTKKQVLPNMIYKIQRFVHLCDYLASRKCLTVTRDDGKPLEPLSDEELFNE